MYTIVTSKFESRQLEPKLRKLEELNRRADKLGLPDVKMDYTSEMITEVDGDGYEYSYPIYTFTVTGPVLKIDGWKLIGKLDHAECLALPVPGETIPDQYRGADSKCDHCETNRRRNETFIVQNDQGDYMQLGGNCLGLYLGIDPGTALQMSVFSTQWNCLRDDDDLGDLGGGGGAPLFWRLEFFMSWVVRWVQEHGWVSRKDAEELRKCATADAVLFLLADRFAFVKATPPNDADQKLATNVINWMKSLEGNDDYTYNLKTIAENEFMTAKSAGLAASAYIAFMRAEEEKLAAENSKYIGHTGDKIKLTVELVSRTGYDTMYGYITCYKFRDIVTGATVVWKTKAGGVEFGQQYAFTAKVKDHTEFRGKKETVVTHAKLEVI